jgi:hypothetical protein
MTEIFHITHCNNLPGIINAGGLWCDRKAGPAVRIGHQHIKDRRLARTVSCNPGGFVGDYVPFYFAPRSPMLFAIHKGSVEGYAEGEQEVVHLFSTVEIVMATSLSWVFSDGHAEMAPLTSFYNRLADLDKIDWEIMRSRYWFDSDEHPDRKRRRQAEFLVHDFFPWRLIRGIGVFGETTAIKVRAILENANHKPDVVVEREWYF